jgi:hypothetical protein
MGHRRNLPLRIDPFAFKFFLNNPDTYTELPLSHTGGSSSQFGEKEEGLP